jgi:4-amino-4-deoxy-L-arabinose transferase-like glycosyltransferase
MLELARRPSGGVGAAERLLWAWLVGDVVFLSAAGSKLATYVLPALPAVAILAAIRVTDATAGPAHDRFRLVGAAITGALPLVAAVVLERVQGTPPAQWHGYVAALGPLALLGWASEGTRAAAWPPPVRVLAVTAASLVVVALTIRPMVAGQLTARGLSSHFNREGAMPSRLYIIDEGVGSFLFYLRPDLRRGLTADRVQRVSRFSLADTPDPGGAIVAVASDRLDGVTELYDLPVQAAAGVDRLGGFVVMPRAEVRPKAR